MAAVSFPASGLFSFFRLWRQPAAECPSCRVCGKVRDSVAEVLLSQGHVRAGIWSMRCEFEQALVAVVTEIALVTGHGTPKTRARHHAVQFLVDQGYLTQSAGNRIMKSYSAASEVVHGELPSKFQAAQVIYRLRKATTTLANITPKVVAAPSQDYEGAAMPGREAVTA